MSQFSGMGTVGNAYIRTGWCEVSKICKNIFVVSVYVRGKYLEIVNEAVELSMQKTVDEIKTLQDYKKEGEVCKFYVPCS